MKPECGNYLQSYFKLWMRAIFDSDVYEKLGNFPLFFPVFLNCDGRAAEYGGMGDTVPS